MSDPLEGVPMQADPRPHADAVRKRQRARATVLALLLGAFVVLVFAISIAKIKAGMHPPGTSPVEQSDSH